MVRVGVQRYCPGLYKVEALTPSIVEQLGASGNVMVIELPSDVIDFGTG